MYIDSENAKSLCGVFLVLLVVLIKYLLTE